MYKKRFFSDYPLLHRNITSPRTLTAEDIKTILWTAIELRTKFKGQAQRIDNVKDAHITYMLKAPPLYMQMPAVKSSEFLQTKLSVFSDPHWDQTEYLSDVFKYLEMSTDLIFFQTSFHGKLRNVPNLSIPVINVESSRYKIMQTLSDFMTIYLKHKRLNGLTLAWIGPPNALFNSYLLIAPNVGLNIVYHCAICQGSSMSPAMLTLAKRLCQSTKTSVTECMTVEEAMKGAHVVAICSATHSDHKLTLQLLKTADQNWSALTEFPRSSNAIDNAVFNHPNCLAWDATYNLRWIFASVILSTLCTYKHTTPKPEF